MIHDHDLCNLNSNQTMEKADVETLTETKIANQIIKIYDDLRLLGYPELLKTSLSKKPSEILAVYFQNTTSRLNLI